MPTKQQLHDLVDRLPDESTDAAARMLAGLAADPVSLTSLLAPFDDEPVSDDERRAVTEALMDPSPSVPHEQVLREFGLK